MKFTRNGGNSPKHILVSRRDAIGDVALTIPLCGLIKELFPGVQITFIGKTYTKPVTDCCEAIDHFLNADELDSLDETGQIHLLARTGADTILHVFPDRRIAASAKKAGIPTRVGTRNRWFHWLTCNRLIALSRKNSTLHEAELNLRLLSGLGITSFPGLNRLPQFYRFRLPGQKPGSTQYSPKEPFKLILHPKSHGSGAEWGLGRFEELIAMLDPQKITVFITGSQNERTILEPWTGALPDGTTVTDLSGKLSLPELIAFIASADGLIASGTGPLHLAAMAGIHTLGLFPAKQPINARRWAPVGLKAGYLTSNTDDVDDILPAEVLARVNSWLA